MNTYTLTFDWWKATEDDAEFDCPACGEAIQENEPLTERPGPPIGSRPTIESLHADCFARDCVAVDLDNLP